MTMTELQLRQAKPAGKRYSISDGRGLLLEVHPSGKKYWVVRYWEERRERRKVIGSYPELSLREARAQNDELRKVLATGKPIGHDRETLASVMDEWLEKRMGPTRSPGYIRVIRLRIKKYILPAFGSARLTDISSGDVLRLCRKIEGEGIPETAARIKQILGQVFRYAIATDRLETDPTVAIAGALQPRQPKHYATITAPDKIAFLIRQIDDYPFAVVRLALRFSALTFARPGEIRHGEWAEIDLEQAEWRLAAEKMKMKRPHIVPLSRQAIEVLQELQPYTGKKRWLFPSARNDGRPMSEGTIRAALRSLGYTNDDMTPHGFRAMASTSLNGQGYSSDIIERQLAHEEKTRSAPHTTMPSTFPNVGR